VSISSSPLERARTDIDVLHDRGFFIAGEWHRDSAEKLQHRNPATGAVQAEFLLAGSAHVDRGVQAAAGAFADWRGLPANERRACLLEIARGLREAAETFDLVAALECGRPLRLGAGAHVAADYFEYYAGWTDKLAGYTAPAYPGDALDYTLPEPIGIIGALVGWNGPLTQMARKVAPALAGGNCVIIKSPELAPFAGYRFAEVCQAAGLPDGVLTVLAGDADAGSAMVEHPGIGKISLTGGTSTARRVMAAASQTLKPLTLELGGKSASLVFADADLDAVADFSAFWGAVSGAGQGCLLPTRLLVERKVYPELIERIVALLGAVTIGDPLEKNVLMGPVISEAACERILGFVSRAEARGEGRLIYGGRRLGAHLADGFFIPPTVLIDVDNHSELAQEEVFGPVLSIIPFDSQAEAIDLANATRYGLAGYIHTSDLKRAHRVAQRLDAGYISINGVCPMPPSVPFGGRKASGFGHEGGLEGILEFVHTKNVYVALGEMSRILRPAVGTRGSK
jgi:aldehyde dehydrogenase (NAD+)